MRLLGRLMVLLFLMAIGAAAAGALRPVLNGIIVHSEGAPPEPNISRSAVYALSAVTWTRFPFSNPPRLVRLLSNADIAPAAMSDPTAGRRYAIEYQIVDASGTVLRQNVLHLGTQISAYVDPETEEMVFAARYADHDAVPTTSDLVTLDLGDLAGAAELRARLVGSETSKHVDAEVSGAALRVYERRPIREGRVLAAWERLNPENQALLARSSVFAAQLLTADERAWLIRNNWLPIGPVGVAGVDYNIRTLITLSDGTSGVLVPSPRTSNGVYVDAERRVTLELPEGGGRVRFVVEIPAGSPAESLTVVSYQRQPEGNVRRAYPLTGEAAQFEDEFSGSMLEVSAEAPLRLRAFLLTEGDEARELTDEVNRVRAYTLLPMDPLHYAVTTIDTAPTPFRLVLRCECATDRNKRAEPVEVQYVVSASDNTIIREGWIPVATEASPYDRLSDSPALPLSIPTEVFFNLPEEAAKVSLFSDAPVVAYAFTRPPDVPRHFMIPEDSLADDNIEVSSRTWFYLRPEGWDAMNSEGRAPLVEAPARPTEPDPEIAAGRYDWEQFLPEGDWLARELLIPASDDTVPRPEALASSYVSIPIGQEQRLDFPSRLGSQVVEPELVYMKPEAEPASIAVWVDGQEVFRGTAIGTRGSLLLPALKTGTRRVVVESSNDISVFMNNIENRPVSLRRRQAIRLPMGQTVFQIEKRTQAEELVVARVFLSADAGRQTLRVFLEDLVRPFGPVNEWTLAEREYSIATGTGAPDVAVLSSDQMVGPERRFTVSLGADLPAGKYTLRVVLEEGPELYLALSRTTPIVAQRNMVQE